VKECLLNAPHKLHPRSTKEAVTRFLSWSRTRYSFLSWSINEHYMSTTQTEDHLYIVWITVVQEPNPGVHHASDWQAKNKYLTIRHIGDVFKNTNTKVWRQYWRRNTIYKQYISLTKIVIGWLSPQAPVYTTAIK